MSAALKLSSSTPTIEEFDPTVIPFQYKVLCDIENFNYEYVQEVLLSGTIGSAKTLLLAHIIAVHMIKFPGAIVGVGRLSLPDIKETTIQVLRDHLGEIVPYKYRDQQGDLYLPNGSKMLAYSWIDKRYTKFRSQQFSLFVIEELTENATKDAYDAIKMRIRLPHVPQKLLIAATNPDGPSHWGHKYFIREPSPNRHVYYSKADQNPFLSKTYIEGVRETLDAKMARRMLEGEWVDIRSDVIYYNYNREVNFVDSDYKINPMYPIHISFDFNIGVGKPFSVCLFQYIDRKFHFFDEVVIESTRTEQALEEIEERGIFENPVKFRVHGDATGKARSTQSKHSDYDIISNYLSRVRRKDKSPIQFTIDVPSANPPLRTRHNNVNASFCNANGVVNLYVYRKAKTLDEGFTLTKLKEGADYIEDDGPKCPYQHITTGAGYGICYLLNESQSKAPGMVARR